MIVDLAFESDSASPETFEAFLDRVLDELQKIGVEADVTASLAKYEASFDLYEEDEPMAIVFAAFNRAAKGVTEPPHPSKEKATPVPEDGGELGFENAGRLDANHHGCGNIQPMPNPYGGPRRCHSYGLQPLGDAAVPQASDCEGS